jgi:lantibiotic biosynthesis protein
LTGELLLHVSKARTWKCLLNGRLRERALEATDSISENLRKRHLKDASLSNGHAGLAVFYAYLAEARPGCGHEKTALRCLDQATDALAATKMSASFFGGFTGIAWAVEHLGRQLWPESCDEDLSQPVAEALKIHLGLSPWRGDYDLVSGLVGFGLYALERSPRQIAVECLELVVSRLDETAERTALGITWFTAPELLSSYQQQLCPKGYYNLGLAHGVPGVLVLLGEICAAVDERIQAIRAKARPLLDGAVAWLLAQQPANRMHSFPGWIGPGVPATEHRLAWCYGDLGIAAALLRAARCADEPAWEQEALVIGHRAAERSAEQSGIVDCGLCHGAAGAGHLFNRLFQATNETRFAAAARFWFERALEMRRSDQGIAGFVAFMPARKRPNAKQWIAAPGILEGAAGIGLALLAATTAIEPEWDRMFLLSARHSLASAPRLLLPQHR